MGTVWAATHVVTSKPVALKILLRARDGDETARRRVLREARAACAVQHPAVAAVHDVVEASDGSPVLVMDLLSGESLGARLAREGPLSLAETLRIVRPVLQALEVAHAAGVVHRDLKPDNLFLVEGGGVKILDFGIAKLLGRDGLAAGSGALTKTGAMVGTPQYMAPEQAFGEAIDARADLWAIGVTMFECLTGEVPTSGANLGQVLRRLTTGQIDSLTGKLPTVPDDIAQLVDSLLAIDKDARPKSAADVLTAIDQATRGASISGDRAPRSSVRPPAATSFQTADGAANTIADRPQKNGRAVVLAVFGGIAVAMGLAFAAVRFAADPAQPMNAAPIAPAATTVAPSMTSSPPPASASSAAPPMASDRPAPSVSAKAVLHTDVPRPPVSAPSAEASAAPGTKLLTKVPF